MIDLVEVSQEGAHEIIEVSTSRAGRAATITIGTVTTGSPGSDANVTNSGTAGEAVLDFTIPTGENVELRINGGYIQWKTAEAETWNNLIEIADITATIGIGTVTTGDPGTDVTFVNAGSGKDAIFNLSIPKGTTFTPSVSAEGVISFTNDGGLTNPSSVNITGPQGPQGAQGPQGNPAPNTIYQYSTDGTTWTTIATGAHWYRQSGDNGVTWSEAIAVSTNDYVDAKITQTITEDVTDKAPSEGAVFDALALKAPLASPALSGTPTTPTPASGTTTTQIVNAQFVDAEFSARLKDASTTVKGVVELATSAEVLAGTDAEKAVTPDTLTDKILGTVSQVGGVPTGAVIESGSNANGSYVKFADGTAICFVIKTVSMAITNVYGTLYSSSTTLTLPLTMSGNYTFAGNFIYPGQAAWLAKMTSSDGSTVYIDVLDMGPRPAADCVIYVICVGRWY